MNDCRFGQPYSLFHSLDLDWVLKEVKSLREEGLTLTALRDELRELVGSDSETSKNSDALGGLPANDYLKKTETAADSEKLGGYPASYYLSKQVALDTYLSKSTAANTYLQKTATAADSSRLGGLPAADYLTESEADNKYALIGAGGGIADDSAKLGGIPAADYLTETEADSKYAPIGAGAVAPPVGSVLIFTNDTDPATLYANTEWTLLDSGRFLMQAGGDITLGATGGEASHTLSVDEMPKHSHAIYAEYSTGNTQVPMWGTYSRNTGTQIIEQRWDESMTVTAFQYGLTSTGNGIAHNNIPPYIAVNIWERTA